MAEKKDNAALPTVRRFLCDLVHDDFYMECRACCGRTYGLIRELSRMNTEDEELGAFFEKCLAGTDDARHSPLFEEDKWPDLKAGPVADPAKSKTVATAIRLKRALELSREFEFYFSGGD